MVFGGIVFYLYWWSSNDFGDEVCFLFVGDYMVIVMDVNNCVDVVIFILV